MTIILNDKPICTAAATLAELAVELRWADRGVAVAIGGAVVPRSRWAETAVEADSHIMVIKAACGG